MFKKNKKRGEGEDKCSATNSTALFSMHIQSLFKQCSTNFTDISMFQIRYKLFVL